MGHVEENARSEKAASFSRGQWFSQLTAFSPASPSIPWSSFSGPFLRPNILLVDESNFQDRVLQNLVLHDCGFDPIATKPMLC